MLWGCPMFVMNKKLKFLKEKLKTWNRNIFGNVHANVTVAEQKLQDIQKLIEDTSYTEFLMNQEKSLQLELELGLDRCELFWKDKDKIN